MQCWCSATSPLSASAVRSWSRGPTAATRRRWSLSRTAESALRKELTGNPGRQRASVQWLRRAFPVTLSEQGVIGGQGLPAVLISASGELRPAATAAVSERRMRPLRARRAADAHRLAGGRRRRSRRRRPQPIPPSPAADGIVALKRLVPEWAIRLLVGALLLPALLTAFDAFFRARRRGLPVGRWLAWVASFALVGLLAWGWARALT